MTAIDMGPQPAGDLDTASPGERYLTLLRRALAHFQRLTADQTDPREAEIEDALRMAEAAAERAGHKQRDAARQARETALAAAEQEWEQLRGAAEERFRANAAALERNLQTVRARLTSEHNEVVIQARRAREEAVLLAETVATATIEGHLRDLRRQEQALREIEKKRMALEQHTAELCAKFRAVATKTERVAPEPPPPERVFDLLEQSTRAVSALEQLRLPNLMAGANPYLLGGVIVAVIAGLFAVLPLLKMDLGIASYITAPAAGGISLIIVLLIGRALAKAARRQAGDAATQAGALCEQLRLAVEGSLAAAQARFKKAETAVIERRASEIGQADERLNQIADQARQRRDGALEKLDQEFHAKKIHFERQRDEQLAKGAAELTEKRRQAGDALARSSAAAEAEQTTQRNRAQNERLAAQERLERSWDDGVAALRELIDQTRTLRLPEFDPQTDSVNSPWEVARDFIADVPFGALELDLGRLARGILSRGDLPEARNGPLRLPAVLPLPTQGSLLIETGRAGRPAAIELLRALMVRLLTTLPPGQARFTIFDPIGLGENFAGLMHLTDHQEALLGGRIWTERDQIEGRLTDLTAHMETVIQKYLRNEFATIAAYNTQAGELAEPYRFLVVTDYPAGFSEAALERLLSIVRSGARCGVFTLIACDTQRPELNAAQWDDLRERSIHILHTPEGFRFADPVLRPHRLELERPPAEARLTEIMHAVGRMAQNSLRVEVPFDAIAPKPEEFWSGNSRAEVRAPIGRSGALRLQHFRLGQGLTQHALVAGKTGSGKSTLLHVLITNLSMWYSPAEVEFYLVDFKKGVEFKAYATHRLPHARAIAIESDREFGLSVLQRVDAEMQRRGELYRAAGAQDMAGYRAARGATLPRTLLIIDEFQVFFSEDDRLAQEAGVLLDRLVRQGRAFGVHVLLGSQTLAGNVAMARGTLGQMAVRIALQCAEADAQLIMDDTNTAARLLTRPGEAIYNDSGGLVDGNSPFQTAWLSDEDRAKRLAQVSQLVQTRGLEIAAPIIFEGNAPADLSANALLAAALRGAAGDEPPRAWLGEPVAIKDPTSVVFRRQPGAHLLIIGQQDRAAMAMMGAALLALAAQRATNRIRFVILDGSPEDQQNQSGLAQAAAALPHDIEQVPYRDVAAKIHELADIVRQRLDGTANETTSIMLMIHGLQRYRALRRGDDDYSFSANSDDQPPKPDKELALILREGPAVGVHVLAWCDTLANLERTFDRAGVREFDNRLLFQMSANDSSHLIDSPEANRLGPYRALLFSEERGVMEKLRPYDAFGPDWLADAARHLRARNP